MDSGGDAAVVDAALADIAAAVAEAKALIDPIPSWLVQPYANQMADIFARLDDATVRLQALVATGS